MSSTWEVNWVLNPQIQRYLPSPALPGFSLHPTPHIEAVGCTLGLEMWFVSSRDRLNHLSDIPVRGVRKKTRGSVLEPESNPHGIQADLPKYSGGTIMLHPALSCKGWSVGVFPLGVKQRGCCSSGGYAQGLHVEEEQIPLH